jgi:hypothetical protein
MTGESIEMVTKSSATNGMLSRNDGITDSIDRNHSDIVKFGEHDPECSRIVDELRKMIGRALERHNT